MHLKRQEVPKRWPIERKGTTYVVRPSFNLKNGIPILVVLRNMLNLAKNRKEVKRAIHLKQILVNGKIVGDEKNSVSLFDTISIAPSNEHYRIELSKGKKFDLRRIKESESREFIIGTENGILHRLKKENPSKKFYPASPLAICPNIKYTNL